MSRRILKTNETSPKRRSKRIFRLPIVTNVKVKYIRPKYKCLKDWMDDPNNAYIGRAGVVFIDKKRFPVDQSTWANPFKIGRDGNRDQVISKYKEYIEKRIENEPELKKELMDLEGKRLGCWCVSPESSECENKLVCHGQILVQLCRDIHISQNKLI